jgi:hypothetical protein
MRWRKNRPSPNVGGKSHVFESPMLFAPPGIKKTFHDEGGKKPPHAMTLKITFCKIDT